MASLREFLAGQADRLKTQESEALKRRDEWLAAVDRLFAQIRTWLQQADSSRVLKIEECQVGVREEGIGSYRVRRLRIELGSKEIQIDPVARTVAGPLSATGVIHVPRSFGRVDMTDGLRKYMIFRVEREPEDRWSIIEQDGFRMRPFDQDSFESALQSLLE